MSEQFNNPHTPKIRFPEFKDSGDWEEKKLGEVGTFLKGKNLSKDDIIINGKYECVRYGELYTVYNEIINTVFSKTNLNPNENIISEYGDVLIPSSGETQIDIAKASCIFKNGVILGGDLNILRGAENGAFISYYVNGNLKPKIAIMAQGNSVVHLYSSQLKNLKISLPPLPEQQKIADFLTAVDEKIGLLTREHTLWQSYKKGIMQRIFRGGRHTDESRYLMPLKEMPCQARHDAIRFTDENHTPYPDWEEKKLGEVFYHEKGNGLSKDKILENGKFECILYGELYTKYNEVIFNVFSKTNHNEGLQSEIGDLLIPSSTTTTGIDLANITALNQKNVLLGGDITVLRSKYKINNIFYAYYLSNYKKYEIASYAQGSTIVHLYYSHMKSMKISLPSLPEQQKIADFLSSIDEKINLVKQQLDKTKEFKKGLLQKMFV